MDPTSERRVTPAGSVNSVGSTDSEKKLTRELHLLLNVGEINRSTDGQIKDNLNTKTGGRFLNRLINNIKSYYKSATDEKDILEKFRKGAGLTLWSVLAVVGGGVAAIPLGIVVGALFFSLAGAVALADTAEKGPRALVIGIKTSILWGAAGFLCGVKVGAGYLLDAVEIPYYAGVDRKEWSLFHKIHYKIHGPRFDETIKKLEKYSRKIDGKTEKMEKTDDKKLKAVLSELQEEQKTCAQELVKNNLLLFKGFEKGLIKIRDKTENEKIMKLLIEQMYESYTDKAKADKIIEKLLNNTDVKIKKYMKKISQKKSSLQNQKYQGKIDLLTLFFEILSDPELV